MQSKSKRSIPRIGTAESERPHCCERPDHEQGKGASKTYVFSVFQRTPLLAVYLAQEISNRWRERCLRIPPAPFGEGSEHGVALSRIRHEGTA